MSNEVNQQHGTPPTRVYRVSLRAMLGAVAFVALICALVVQYIDLSRTRASLARYESSRISTKLRSNEFRVIARDVVKTDHVIVISYRIESLSDHFATIRIGTDGNGSRAHFDPATNLYVTQAELVIDHMKSKNALKEMAKVSGAQGYSVASVPDEFSLEDAIEIRELNAVYSRNDAAELLELRGRRYVLQLKP